MDNLDNFLAATPEESEVTPEVVETPEAVEQPVAETPEGETPEQKATRERDEKGRFKAKEEKPEVPEGLVPLKVVQELREELRALKAPAPQPQQPVSPPDIFEDPEGFASYQSAQIQWHTLNTTLNLSESMAKRYAGADTVEEAKQWGNQAFSANPTLYQQFLQQPDPYGFLIEQYKKASTFAKLGDDPTTIEEFIKWREAQSAPQPTPAPVAVPSTLADAQSARGSSEGIHVPSLDEILGRKIT